MPLSFVLDEQLRGPLWNAILRHNARGSYPLDVVRVGDEPLLPLSALDPEVLLWAEQHGRILITEDKRTMPGHLTAHLAAGRHSPGILLVSLGCTVPRALSFLVAAAYA